MGRPFPASMVRTLAPANYPSPKSGDWIVRNFKFHTGETMPELRLHYTTIGESSAEPVLVLHGSGESGTHMLNPNFAGSLFGRDQPLDASKYYVVIPDAIGHGQSSKPSDGLKTRFPKYDYTDMVDAQYRLITECLGIKHLRLIIGYSMGGMHAWIWATRYPRFMDALIPMASQPSAMAGRNWMLRRIMIETIRNDSEYNNGNYTAQPQVMRYAINAYQIATDGGTLAYQRLAPTTEKASKIVNDRLAAPVTSDANDFIYQWEASGNYDPSTNLEQIQATLLAINSADDERNPPETGVMEAALTRLKSGRLHLIPASINTCGHHTTCNAALYREQLAQLLRAAPRNMP
ncbi:MAG TPA: alpha/beta fold hydrolase [Afipia sp.]